MRADQVKEQGHKLRWCLVILGWVTVSALLLTVGSGCGKKDKAAEGEVKEDSTMAVSTATPKTQLLRRFILQPGVLKSYEETPIYTKLAGYLETINVDIGDKISKGELLAELWVPEVDEAVRVKESKVEEGKADVTQAEETLRAAEANIITWRARVNEAEASVIRAQALFVRWDEEYKRDLDFKVDKDPKKEWFKLTDQVFAALKTDNVPESVLAKLKPLKNKVFARDKFVEEIKKFLNADDMRQFQSLILNHAPKKLGFLDSGSVEETEKQRDAAGAAVKETQAGVISAKSSLDESIAKRDRAKADVQVNKTQLVVWERELEYQKRWFEYARITAPYDGIVTRRIVHTGHFVQPTNSGTTSMAAEPLFVVMRTDIIRVVIQVPEYDAPLVKDGADAIVRLQAYRGQEIKCKVTRSSWALDKDARTLRVEIFLDNPAWINLTDRAFAILRNEVWFKLTDQAIVALKSEKVPDVVLAKLNPLKNLELAQNDFTGKVIKILNAEAKCKLTDQVFAALKNANVPESVLMKLKPLKHEEFSRDKFAAVAGAAGSLSLKNEGVSQDKLVEELNKLLNADEKKQFQSLIVKHAIADEKDRWENLILNHTRRNVPDAVLAKLSPLKNKELSQKDFVNELGKLLNADEMQRFQDVILKRADSPNAPMKLQAGMYGNISITADVPNALTLPSQAILTDGNKNYCFAIEGGKARRINVKIGIANDKITEILMKQAPPTKPGEEGAWVKFTGSEQIITSNLTSIQDGQPVKGK